MLGIPDPGIWLAYVLAVVCVAFSIWFGIKYWNEEDSEEEMIKK
jgi:TRAP-type C4-dicarboxylate transport system permease small subunit